MERVVHRTCTWCEACCGITVRVEDERIVDIRGDEEDPFSRGYICPKAYALKELHEDPDRLRHPMKRTSVGWERISWKEAFDYAAEGLLAVQEKHGRHAAAVYLGNPNVHNVEAILFAQETVRALGTRNRFSASTLDQMPKQMVQHFLYGSGLFFSVPDVDRTAYMLILGANPLASNGSLMTAPDMRRRLQRIRDRGGKVVLVDPRRTESAKVADRHYFIRPGTDALLVAAMIQTLFAEDRVRLGRLASFTDGVDTLRRELADFTPEAAAPRVGVGAEEIRRIARDFSDAESAVCYGRMGASTVRFGAAATWLIEALNVLTGNLDRPGGMMFPTPCVDVLKLQPRTRYGRWRSRTRGTPEFMGELPAATLADEIATAGEGQVRALLTVAGNPVLSSPAGHKLSEALAKLDFMVSVDFYLNETTRHARVILPPVGPLEHDHYDMAFQLLSVQNTTRWSPKVFDPPADTKGDAEILLELAARLQWARGGSARAQALGYRALAALGGARATRLLVDAALRMGPRGDKFLPWKDGLSLKKIVDSVHGLDFGPLEPRLPKALPSPTRRIDLAPGLFVGDIARMRAALAEAAPDLHLIGRRELRTNNSWSHNLPSLVKGPARCVLFMHPTDAEARGLATGDLARIESRVGAVEAPVKATEDVMPGVVSLPHGYGHGLPETKMKVAAVYAGVSINDLTDPAEIDPVSGNAVLSGTPVRVAKAASAASAA